MAGLHHDETLESLDGLAQVERHSLADQVTELIRQAIVDGVLPAGGQVSLRQIARQLQVSVTPVREALFQLRAIGLVEFLPGKVRIATPNETSLHAAFELREALEGMAARLAAARRSAAEAARIVRLADESLEAAEAGDRLAFRDVDIAFHHAIAAAARSEQVARYTRHALDLALTLRNLRTGPSFNPRFASMHPDIAGAIERQEPAEAERLGREHVRNVCTMILDRPAGT